MRADGQHSRQTILRAAANLATVDGLEGLSIGGLAKQTGMSKSGLYAHFKSKQELQLATIATALQLYETEVVKPALVHETALGRLTALCENFLSYAERRIFPGGCFFSSVDSEMAARPGPVRNALARMNVEWTGNLVGLATLARDEGSLDRDVDPAQLAFELDAFMHQANDAFVLLQDTAVFARARQAIAGRLSTAGG
jgi:AcrR family transcriptional regulator